MVGIVEKIKNSKLREKTKSLFLYIKNKRREKTIKQNHFRRQKMKEELLVYGMDYPRKKKPYRKDTRN